MKLYQLKVIKKNFFKREVEVVHDFLFNEKGIAFESLLRSYLKTLESIKNKEHLCSLTTYQDDETEVEKRDSYLWKIECTCSNKGGFLQRKVDEEEVYEFHLNPVEIQKDVPSILEINLTSTSNSLNKNESEEHVKPNPDYDDVYDDYDFNADLPFI